jgi:hypothetical protein
MNIKGGCHCGNITFELDWSPEPTEIPARACSCSFCQKHGGIWTSCPSGALAVLFRNPDQVTRYSFGTHTADFHVCQQCGVVPVVSSEIDGHLYAVVSVRAMQDVDPALLKHGSISFEGEATDSRLARRAKGWIRRVEFRSAVG